MGLPCLDVVLRLTARGIKLLVKMLAVSAPLILQLPISFLSFCDTSAFDKVGEAGEAAPYDCRAWWRIRCAIKIAPKPRNNPDIEIEIARNLLFVFCRQALEQGALGFGEDGSG
jgi:hypothetical protein